MINDKDFRREYIRPLQRVGYVLKKETKEIYSFEVSEWNRENRYLQGLIIQLELWGWTLIEDKRKWQ